MFIYNGTEFNTIKDIDGRANSIRQWFLRSSIVGTQISHVDAITVVPAYKGSKGVVAYTNEEVEAYTSRFTADEAKKRGTDIHTRTMKVDYVRDQPRSYQAQYIKAISKDGFIAEYAIDGGRIDAFYYDPKSKTAHIVDFKTGGFGDYSEQMAKYVKAIREEYPKATIITHIIYIDQWETTTTIIGQ